MKRIKEKQPDINYYFILKCMAALTAAAAVTAGIIIAATAKAGGASLVASTAAAVSPVFLPFTAFCLLIGGICLLPFLCGGNASTTRTHGWGRSGWGYNGGSFWGGSSATVVEPNHNHGHYPQSNVHGHGRSTESHGHGHSSTISYPDTNFGSTVHGHP